MTDIDDDETRGMKDIDRELALRAYATIKSGAEAIKALTYINGGSAVAMLAVMGIIASKDQYTSDQIAFVAGPLIWFATGLGLAVAAACLSYLCNSATAQLSRTRPRISEPPYVGKGSRLWSGVQVTLLALTIAAAALSLGSFGRGVWTAEQAFEQSKARTTHDAGSGTKRH